MCLVNLMNNQQWSGRSMETKKILYNLMVNRRSIRLFKNRKPAKEILEQLIQAAVTAPSASNKQPWRFQVIMNDELIQIAALEVEQERQNIISMIPEEFRAQFEEYSVNFLAFQHAPALIVITCRPFPLLSQLLEDNATATYLNTIRKVESDSALISTACAMQNILLMAESLDLGACCMTGPLVAAEKLKQCWSICEGWEIASLIAVGYADEQPIMQPRKPLHSVVRWSL